MGEEYEYDSELFIKEIRCRPAIWDTYSEMYKDRLKKKSSWEEVCRMFCSRYDEMEENQKNEIGRKLLHKWRNIRDAYVKCLKCEKDSQTGSKRKKRRYIFGEQLEFLRNIIMSSQSTNVKTGVEEELPSQNEVLSSPEDTFPGQFQSQMSYQHTGREKDSGKKLSFEDKLIAILEKNGPSDTDEDTAFFYSILPVLKNFNEDQKLEFRLEVLNIIKKLKNISSSSSYTSSISECYSQQQMQYMPPNSVWPPNVPIYHPEVSLNCSTKRLKGNQNIPIITTSRNHNISPQATPEVENLMPSEERRITPNYTSPEPSSMSHNSDLSEDDASSIFARTVPTVIEEELKARLGIMEEKRLQQQAEHECKMRHYRRQDEIAAEELQRAVAERKLAEARLQQFLEGDVLTEKDAAPRTEEEKETVNINKRKSRNVTEKTIESEMERSEVSSNVTTPKKMINYNPDVAVGQILLSQVNGFYCHPCRRFFFREDQAFQLHCRTLSHFNNYLVFIKSQVHDESCNEAEEKDSNKSQLKNRPSVDKSKHSEGEKDANEIKEELLYEDEVAEDAEISGIPVNESEIIDVQNNMPLEKGCPETKEIEYSEEELLGGEDEGAGETEIIIKVESEEAMEAEI